MILLLITIALLLVGIACYIIFNRDILADIPCGLLVLSITLIFGASMGIILEVTFACIARLPISVEHMKYKLDERIETLQYNRNIIVQGYDDSHERISPKEHNESVDMLCIEIKENQLYLDNLFLNIYANPVYDHYKLADIEMLKVTSQSEMLI